MSLIENIFTKLLLVLLFFLSHLFCSNFVSPETVFNSLKPTESEGDYSKCSGIAFSPITGDLYFSDESLGKIFRIFNGETQLVAGTDLIGYKDSSFLSAQFGSLRGIAFGPNGSFLLIADRGNHVIRMLDFEKGSVSTVAGIPNQPGMADGLKAKFYSPSDIVVKSGGKIAFVVDNGNNRIRKIDLTNGNVSTIAGTGFRNFNGDEGLAIKVNIPYPRTIMYQESSNLLFITDGLCAIRIINGTGYLKTLLKDCDIIPYPWGIVEKDNTTILVSDLLRNVIYSVNIYTSSINIFAGGPSGGFFDGSKLEATFSTPTFMALDPFSRDDLYISDYNNAAIRKLSKSGYVSTEMKTIGSGLEDGYMGQARFSSPTYLALDEISNILYVSDTSNHAIRRIYLDDNFKVDILTGKPYGGYLDGSLDTALFSFPLSLLLHEQNDTKILYVCDSGNSIVRVIYLSRNLVKTSISLSNHYSTIFLKGDSVYEAPKSLYYGTYYFPYSAAWLDNNTLIMSIGPLNSIWLGEWYNNVFNSKRIAGNANADGFGYKDGDSMSAKFSTPIGIVLFNETIFIADKFNFVIRSLDISKSVVSTYFGSGKTGYRNGPSFMSELKSPNDIKIDRNGTFYIADEQSHAIRMVKDGVMETIAGFGSNVSHYDIKEFVFGLECLATVSEKRFLVSDKRNNVIFSLTFNGTAYIIEPIIGSGMIGLKDGIGLESMLKGPTDLAFSSSNSVLYIADSGNHAIRAYDMKTGYLSTLFTSLLVKPVPNITLKKSQGIALDTIENKLFIADTDNHGIKVLDLASNSLTLVAGSRISAPGFKDSWFGEFSLFAFPIGIAVSAKDKVIYVCDSYNHAIRKVLYNGTVTTLANVNGLPGYLDGNLTHSKMLYPTKLALSSDRKRIYILDSGNYRIRMIDLQTETMTMVLDTKSWPINNFHLDEFDNLYANNRRTIKVFKSIPSKTANSQTNFVNVVIVIVSICLSVLILAFAAFYLLSRKRRSKNVAQKLALVGQHDLKASPELTATISLSRTVAISLPGHLCLDKSLKQISFEQGDLKSGGTAQVIKGKVRDPEMISKNGIVDVAIKVVNTNEANKQTVLESFRYEVALMAALPESTCLIKLIGYCLDPMVIVMKYYGMNLQECLDLKQFFTSKDIKMKAMRDIAEGMSLVHSKDIIHFDLKPGNILIDLNFQSQSNFVICDFGFADFSEEAGRQFVAGMKKPTVQGITIRYAAPELLMRHFNFAHQEDLKKVDVYAFAMIAYYIWFETKPWGKEKLEEVQAKVLQSERPTFPDSKDEEMKDLIQNCWNQDPRKRPTFDGIIEELNKVN